MFNGEQMRNMPKWEKEPDILSPAERAQLILENSNAVIEHGGDDMYYDRDLGAIIIPEKEQFANPEQYYAEALHQLAHRTNWIRREAVRPSAGRTTMRATLS